MKTTIKLWYEEKYLPNKRCRKLRERAVSKDVDIEVCEVTKEEFPVAFVIHDYESVYEGAKSYSDFEGNGDYRMFSEEIRTYNGKLYKPLRVTYGTAISTNFESLDTLFKDFENKYSLIFKKLEKLRIAIQIYIENSFPPKGEG